MIQSSPTSCIFLSLDLISRTVKYPEPYFCFLACCVVIGVVLTMGNRSSSTGYGTLFYTSELLMSDLGGGILAQADYGHCQYSSVKKKLHCTLVQALRLCTGHPAHRRSRGIAVLFLDHGTKRGWVVNVTPRPLFTPVKDPVPIVQEAGWAPAPVWTGAENLALTGIRSPDRPARSKSLYRLSYPDPETVHIRTFR